jgi:3-oxoadipate enol-lactonase
MQQGETKAADGCRLAYTLHPRPGRPKVALIHSLALDRSFWNRVVATLGDGFEILAYDCRGHGASEHRAGDYTVEQFGEDLKALFDHLGWKKAIVAGCSMGGCIAQAFAVAHPEMVQALGLIDTTAWYGVEAPKAWRERAQAAADKGLASLIGFQIDRWFSDGFRKEHPEIADALVKVFTANDVACYQATCRMLGDADLRERVAKLALPTAVFVGEEDYATPVAMAETLHGLIKGSSLTVIKGGRHLTPVQCPDDIAGMIKSLAR